MKRKRLIFVLKIFAGLLVVLAVAAWGWNESTKTALAAAQARCRAAGLPMSIEEIRPPPVPDADNAALVIAKLEPLLRALPAPDTSGFFATLEEFEYNHPTYVLNAAGTKELAEMLDSYPAKLAELVPEFLCEVPPLFYLPEPGGAMVYSTAKPPGPNGDGLSDNGDHLEDQEGWSAGTAAVRKFAPKSDPAQ